MKSAVAVDNKTSSTLEHALKMVSSKVVKDLAARHAGIDSDFSFEIKHLDSAESIDCSGVRIVNICGLLLGFTGSCTGHLLIAADNSLVNSIRELMQLENIVDDSDNSREKLILGEIASLLCKYLAEGLTDELGARVTIFNPVIVVDKAKYIRSIVADRGIKLGEQILELTFSLMIKGVKRPMKLTIEPSSELLSFLECRPAR